MDASGYFLFSSYSVQGKVIIFSIIKVYIIQHDLNSETVPTKWIGLFFLRPKRWHPHLNIPTE